MLEENTKKRRKKESIQKAVLATVGIAGILAVAAVAPAIFSAVPRLMGRKRYQLAFQTRTAIGRLIVKGHVRFRMRNSKKFIELTDAGKRALALEQRKSALALEKPKRWDRRYRVVLFDIPHHRRKDRDYLRRTLRECGFLRLQDSVWIYPYDCEELVILLKSDMHIGKDVLYGLMEAVENDSWIRRHFGLPLSD